MLSTDKQTDRQTDKLTNATKNITSFAKEGIKEKEEGFIYLPQEFVVRYSKAPEQPQRSARPICHSHVMTRTGREPATIRIAA